MFTILSQNPMRQVFEICSCAIATLMTDEEHHLRHAFAVHEHGGHGECLEHDLRREVIHLDASRASQSTLGQKNLDRRVWMYCVEDPEVYKDRTVWIATNMAGTLNVSNLVCAMRHTARSMASTSYIPKRTKGTSRTLSAS